MRTRNVGVDEGPESVQRHPNPSFVLLNSFVLLYLFVYLNSFVLLNPFVSTRSVCR